MRKRKINRVKDLPEWFDITKYAKVYSLDASGWFDQAAARKMWIPGRFLALTEDGGIALECDPIVKAEFDRWHEDYVNAIWSKGIVNLEETEANISLKKYIAKYSAQQNVRPTSILEIYMAAQKIAAEKVKFFEQLIFPDSTYLNAHTQMAFSYESFHNHYFNDLFQTDVFFTIDLSHPDNLILEKFKRELKNIRQQLPVKIEKRVVSNQDFYRWAEYGVLPYFDLSYWASENNVTIPNRVYADAIFPDGEKGEEAIRKTVQPLTLEFSNIKTLCAIHLAIQNSERNLI